MCGKCAGRGADRRIVCWPVATLSQLHASLCSLHVCEQLISPCAVYRQIITRLRNDQEALVHHVPVEGAVVPVGVVDDTTMVPACRASTSWPNLRSGFSLGSPWTPRRARRPVT